jgi:PST family polysaccharide transporter
MPRSAEPLHDPIPLETIQAGAARHFAVSATAKAATQILRFGTVLVLARLLAPADFGVLAMVMSAIGIAELFRDLGLSQATVRAEQVTHGQVNTLFWINTVLGLLMTCLCLLAAPWLPAFFADDRVAAVAAAMSATFLLNGLAAQHLALLRRTLRFSTIARINFVSAVAGSLVALALAVAGLAYWALVTAAIATSAGNALGAWLASDWRPTRPAFDPGARSMISFGGYLVGFGFLTYLAQNAHIALIGRMFGAGAAGLYTRASTLITQPLSYAIDPLRLILPASLSRLQTDPQAFADHYLRTLSPLMLVSAPFSIWLAITAADVVHVLLGPRWDGAGQVLALLALGTIPQVINSTSGWLYLSRGDARGMMRWGAVGWTVVLAAMVSGLQWGIAGVAAMSSVSMFLIVVPCMYYACRNTQISLPAIWSATWRPVCAALLSAVALLALMRVCATWPSLARLVVTSTAYGIVYAGLMVLAFGERERAVALLQRVRGRWGRRR